MRVAMPPQTHIPVLLNEVVEYLSVQPGGRYIDCTVGAGGHAEAILEHSSPGGQLLGIDSDPAALDIASERLSKFGAAILIINDNFVNLKNICLKYDFFPVHGILYDLGFSSMQLESERGFSFQSNAPLDMRFNPEQEITASDIVNTYSETELSRILRAYGEEPFAHKIAQYIIRARPLQTTSELAEVVEHATGGRRGKIHPATRTFQALRIAVNRELENLESSLNQAISLLGFGGRLVVISYHSLEDRIVKQLFQRESKDCICPPEMPVCRCEHKASINIITKKITTPSFEEIEKNPRARSARLRAAERIVNPSEQYQQTVEQLNCSIGLIPTSLRRPALIEKLRKTFLSLQIGNFADAVKGRLKM